MKNRTWELWEIFFTGTKLEVLLTHVNDAVGFFEGSTQEQGPEPSPVQDAHCVVRARVLRKTGSGALQATPAKRGRGRLSTSRRTGETKKWY